MNAWIKIVFTLAILIHPLIDARTLVFTYTTPEADNLFPSTYHNTKIEFKVTRTSGEEYKVFANQANQELTLTIKDEGPNLLNPYSVIAYVQTISPRSPPLPSFTSTPSVGPVFVQEDGGERFRVFMVINPINLDLPGPLALAYFIF
jgi:hypothetical protein